MKVNKTCSRDAKNGHIKNIKNIFISMASIELCVVIPMKITSEYITANENVSIKIDERNDAFQYPNLKDTINHIVPIKYTRLINIKSRPPTNFPRRICERETGFDSSKSMFPFSSIEGIIEDTPIRQSVIKRRYDTPSVKLSNPRTSSLTSSPDIVTMPSTESKFTKAMKPKIIKVEIAKKPIKIFFAIASRITPNTSVLKIILVLLTD